MGYEADVDKSQQKKETDRLTGIESEVSDIRQSLTDRKRELLGTLQAVEELQM